jgi:hypothetical protein
MLVSVLIGILLMLADADADADDGNDIDSNEQGIYLSSLILYTRAATHLRVLTDLGADFIA